MSKYVEIKASEVPAGIRFDTPRQHQGQSVERSYGGFDRAEHCSGAPYKKVIDQSAQKTTYYKLAK